MTKINRPDSAAKDRPDGVSMRDGRVSEVASRRAAGFSRKFEVDQFIWSRRAPRALRKQYIAPQACAVPAFLCLADLVWMNEPRPDFRALGTAAFSAISFFAAALLAWKALRRRE